MDPMDPNEIQEVRKIIESSTSKVSLRDLEKKGFRKVKVLRSNDIDELIRRAVTAVVAREGGGEGSRVTEELVEKSRQELKTLMTQTQAAERERSDLAERNEALEAKVKESERQIHDVARKLVDAERDASSLRGRLDEAEARAHSSQSLAKQAGGAEAKLGQVRDELDQLRMKTKQLEMERRLVQELEVPKLKERIQDLEAELRVSKAAALAAPSTGGASDEKMRAMFRDILKEVGAGAGAGMDGGAFKAEFAKLQNSIAESLAKAGGRGSGEITEADIAAAKVSIEALFKHDAGVAVQSNIGDVQVRELTQASDLKSKMDKLKALRKGGSK